MKNNDGHLCGQARPTVEQSAWVLSHLDDALREPGSFRHLIYDRMGYNFSAGAYQALYMAGGMNLTNAFSDLEEAESKIELLCAAIGKHQHAMREYKGAEYDLALWETLDKLSVDVPQVPTKCNGVASNV